MLAEGPLTAWRGRLCPGALPPHQVKGKETVTRSGPYQGLVQNSHRLPGLGHILRGSRAEGGESVMSSGALAPGLILAPSTPAPTPHTPPLSPGQVRGNVRQDSRFQLSFFPTGLPPAAEDRGETGPSEPWPWCLLGSACTLTTPPPPAVH